MNLLTFQCRILSCSLLHKRQFVMKPRSGCLLHTGFVLFYAKIIVGFVVAVVVVVDDVESFSSDPSSELPWLSTKIDRRSRERETVVVRSRHHHHHHLRLWLSHLCFCCSCLPLRLDTSYVQIYDRAAAQHDFVLTFSFHTPAHITRQHHPISLPSFVSSSLYLFGHESLNIAPNYRLIKLINLNLLIRVADLIIFLFFSISVLKGKMIRLVWLRGCGLRFHLLSLEKSLFCFLKKKRKKRESKKRSSFKYCINGGKCDLTDDY